MRLHLLPLDVLALQQRYAALSLPKAQLRCLAVQAGLHCLLGGRPEWPVRPASEHALWPLTLWQEAASAQHGGVLALNDWHAHFTHPTHMPYASITKQESVGCFCNNV